MKRYGLTLKMDMENAAFEPRGREAARILRELADRLENLESGLAIGNTHGGYLKDANGNSCGTWEAKQRRIRNS